KLASGPGGPEGLTGGLQKWLAARAGDEARVRAARKRLVEDGLSEAKGKQFPALQVILLDEKYLYEGRPDGPMQAAGRRFWEGEVAPPPPRNNKEETLFAWAVPATFKVRQAQARLEQRLALLRCVEALRLYAAEHGGRLPERLADVKLPLPADPISGKPFVYKLEGGTATVRGTAPAGHGKDPPPDDPHRVSNAKRRRAGHPVIG